MGNLQAISTPTNTLQCPIGTRVVYQGRARVGFAAFTRGSKMVKTDFFLKRVVLAHSEPALTCFGRQKNNGPFWDENWVQRGSKMHFAYIGMPKQVFSACFEPVLDPC